MTVITDLYTGKEVKILTYGPNTWHNAKYSGKRDATQTSREVFYFNGTLGCFAVTAEDLETRVKIKEMFEIWFIDIEGKSSYERTLAFFPEEAEKNIRNFYGQDIEIIKIK